MTQKTEHDITYHKVNFDESLFKGLHGDLSTVYTQESHSAMSSKKVGNTMTATRHVSVDNPQRIPNTSNVYLQKKQSVFCCINAFRQISVIVGYRLHLLNCHEKRQTTPV